MWQEKMRTTEVEKMKISGKTKKREKKQNEKHNDHWHGTQKKRHGYKNLDLLYPFNI